MFLSVGYDAVLGGGIGNGVEKRVLDSTKVARTVSLDVAGPVAMLTAAEAIVIDISREENESRMDVMGGMGVGMRRGVLEH